MPSRKPSRNLRTLYHMRNQAATEQRVAQLTGAFRLRDVAGVVGLERLCDIAELDLGSMDVSSFPLASLPYLSFVEVKDSIRRFGVEDTSKRLREAASKLDPTFSFPVKSVGKSTVGDGRKADIHVIQFQSTKPASRLLLDETNFLREAIEVPLARNIGQITLIANMRGGLTPHLASSGAEALHAAHQHEALVLPFGPLEIVNQ